MKRALLLVCTLLLSWNVSAKEVAGVKLADTVQVGDATLQLNGAGTRTKVIIDVYVGALYVGKKTSSAAEVLADAGPKRVALHMLYGMGSSTLREAFRKAIEANHSEAQLMVLGPSLKKFYAIFDALPGVSEGNVILLDYLPGVGTKVTVNGVEKGVVEGVEVNRAVLRIWLGEDPVEKSLKKAMLGG
jgi:hypothetical protein